MIIVPHWKPKYRRGGGPTMYLRPRYRYGGYGIWSIGRKMAGDSVRKIINSVDKKKIIHKAGDALISGATSSIKKAAEKTLDRVINDNSDKKFKVTKELIDQLPTAGSGIVYD